MDSITHLRLHQIEALTDDFSEDHKIGSGAYGDVYKAVLNGEEIAIKKLHPLQGLDDRGFDNQFRNLNKTHHKNIIGLIGYCYESQHRYIEHNGEILFAKILERLLLFEYMHNGSLDKYIEDEACGLDWPTCYQIIRGTCEGLNHLHNAQEKPIFHLNLNPTNILLDRSMTPKVAGFNLSSCGASLEWTFRTEIIQGRHGYMPPEYINNRFISKKFDVFSLGIIIIQMMAGNRGNFLASEMSSDDFIELVSENWKKRLQASSEYQSHETDMVRVRTCVEIALRCVNMDRKKRPCIEDIVLKLEKPEAVSNKVMSLAPNESKDLVLKKVILGGKRSSSELFHPMDWMGARRVARKLSILNSPADICMAIIPYDCRNNSLMPVPVLPSSSGKQRRARRFVPTVTTQVKPRHVPDVLKQSSSVRAEQGGPNAVDIPAHTPIQMLQAIGVNLCGVPPNEVSSQKLLATPQEDERPSSS